MRFEPQDLGDEPHHHAHGPQVQSIHHARAQMKTFEAMQNISDELTQETEYDEYVDPQTGRIDLSKVCHMLSMTVWGLVMAKARASFTLSDLFDSSQRKKKSNLVFYICIMIGIAQLLKSCAENKYAENFLNDIEDKLDSGLFNVSTLNASVLNDSLGLPAGKHHKRPKVQSSNPEAAVSLDEIIQEREKELEKVSQTFKKEAVNDLETMYKKLKDSGNQFDEEKLRERIIEKRQGKVNGTGEMGTPQNVLKALHKGTTIACFFFVGTASVLSVILARKYHEEADKLHELNKIYHNPKARVVIGRENGEKVVKKMKKFVKQTKAKEPHPIKRRKSGKTLKVAPRIEEVKLDEEQEPLKMDQSFNYSLYDEQPTEDKSGSITEQPKEIELKKLEAPPRKGTSTGPMFTLQQVQ